MIRQRPAIPTSYGIATGFDGMLEWSRVATVLRDATILWVATSRPDGDPHLIPIWGAWADGAAYIEGGDETRWAKNLAGGSAVHVGVDGDGLQVMVRGTAAKHDVDAATQRAIADVYTAKYPYRPEGTTFWVIRPASVLAWSTATVDAFASTPTEFVFEEET
jgi:nitroimidazol reductase NimA-like FMN-containing flavoprotein (pyridoxamine 5'-phosphate oxidase superfamily)